MNWYKIAQRYQEFKDQIKSLLLWFNLTYKNEDEDKGEVIDIQTIGYGRLIELLISEGKVPQGRTPENIAAAMKNYSMNVGNWETEMEEVG